MSIEVVRVLMLASQKEKVVSVKLKVHEDVAAYLNNRKRKEINGLEESGDITVQILGSADVYPEHLEIDCNDSAGQTVKVP